AAAGGARTAVRTARVLAAAGALAEQLGDPYTLGRHLEVAGLTAFLEGKWKLALERCERAEVILRERCTGVSWEIDTAQMIELSCLANLGETAELQARLAARLLEAEERGDLYAATNFRIGPANLAWLARDAVAEARAV